MPASLSSCTCSLAAAVNLASEAVNFFSLGAGGDGAGGGAGSSGTSTEAAAAWTHAGRARDAKVWTPEAISFFTLGEAIENEGVKEASREDLGRSSSPRSAHSTMVSSFLYVSPLNCAREGVKLDSPFSYTALRLTPAGDDVVCVRVCARACARGRVCVCVCVRLRTDNCRLTPPGALHASVHVPRARARA